MILAYCKGLRYHFTYIYIYKMFIAMGGVNLLLRVTFNRAKILRRDRPLSARVQCSGLLLWCYSRSDGLACQQVKVARATFPRGNRALSWLPGCKVAINARDPPPRIGQTSLLLSTFHELILYFALRQCLKELRSVNFLTDLNSFRGSYIHVLHLPRL